jgi:hypothetical protein
MVPAPCDGPRRSSVRQQRTGERGTYPKSKLPGSELGAKIAGSVGKPTGSVAAAGGKATDGGRSIDGSRSGRSGTDRDRGDLY